MTPVHARRRSYTRPSTPAPRRTSAPSAARARRRPRSGARDRRSGSPSSRPSPARCARCACGSCAPTDRWRAARRGRSRSANPAAGARCGRRRCRRSGGAASSPAACPRAPRSRLRSWHWATNHASRARPQRRERREAREVAQPVERVHLAVDEEADADRAEAQLVAQAELVDEGEHALVGGHDHVVEAVDPVAAESKAPARPPSERAALEQRDLRARLRRGAGRASCRARRRRRCRRGEAGSRGAPARRWTARARRAGRVSPARQRRERRRLDAADEVGGHQAAVGDHGRLEVHLRDALRAGSSR